MCKGKEGWIKNQSRKDKTAIFLYVGFRYSETNLQLCRLKLCRFRSLVCTLDLLSIINVTVSVHMWHTIQSNRPYVYIRGKGNVIQVSYFFRLVSQDKANVFSCSKLVQTIQRLMTIMVFTTMSTILTSPPTCFTSFPYLVFFFRFVQTYYHISYRLKSKWTPDLYGITHVTLHGVYLRPEHN